MKKIKVIIFGIGEISQIAHHYLIKDEQYEVSGFTMDKEYIKENKFESLPIIPFDNIQQIFPQNEYKLFIPIGYTQVNKLREKKFIEARDKGYDFISYIHPKATISSNAKIGKNCFIFEDNTIQPYVTIEDNCILWSGNHIGHHSSISPHCFIASHVVISGRCKVGSNCYFGVNSTVRDGITIAPKCTIGAGALIMRDTEENQVYMGLPGKRLPQKSGEVDII